MGTEKEEPDCQKQFQAAVSVIQNLPKNGEAAGIGIWGFRMVRQAPTPPQMEPGLNPAMFTDKFLPRLWWGSSLLPVLDAMGGIRGHLCPPKVQPLFVLSELGLMRCPLPPNPRSGSYRPSYEEMLRFYSYYKQATMGPCLVPRPGFWDPIGRYKW